MPETAGVTNLSQLQNKSIRVRAPGAFYKAGLADPRAVFQGEIDASRRIDIRAAFSATIVGLAHRNSQSSIS
jgi:hypothetical protein